MTWVRLDDQFADHPKIVGLSSNAFRLHVTGICYAAKHETDGMIPFAAAFVITARKAMSELTDAGLWDREETGFLIHDYLEYNPSRASLRAKRAADSVRKNGGIAPDANRTRPDPIPTRKPDPVPHPIPTGDSAAASDSLTACIQTYDSMMGSMATTPTISRKIADWLEDNSGSAYDLVEWFTSACDKAAIQDKRSLGYVFGVLKREAAEGRGDKRPSKNGTSTDPERAEYLAAKGRGTNSGAGLVIHTMSDEAIIARYDAKQREAANAGA